MTKKVVFVSAAVIANEQGQILLQQRPEGKHMGGLWEFPGGKLEENETPEDALVRELKEELSIDIEKELMQPFHFVSHAYDDFHLVMNVYWITAYNGEVTPQEGQYVLWADGEALEAYKSQTPPADIPIFEMLLGADDED